MKASSCMGTKFSKFAKVAISALLGVTVCMGAPTTDAFAATSSSNGRQVDNLNGYYIVKSCTGSRVLDMTAASTSSGGLTQTWDSNGTAAQKWKFTPVGGGYYRITNAYSELALDVPNGRSENGIQLQQCFYHGGDPQLWKAYDMGSGKYVFINKGNGKALDVDSGQDKSGTRVHQWDRNNTNAQKWTLQPVSYTPQPVTSIASGYYCLRNTGSNKYLDMSASSMDNCGNVQIWDKNGCDAEIWRFDRVGNSYYLRNGNSWKAVDVTNAGVDNGVNVQQFDYNGSDAQLWRIYRNMYEAYTLVNVRSGRALDVAGAGTASGTNVHIWDRNDSSAQAWVIEGSPAPQRSEEDALARQIFTEYNNYRASKGLNRVGWNDTMAQWARSSADQCGATRQLTHLLGIPAQFQKSHSDILQYSSWKDSPSGIVQSWIRSNGHRKMMQCNTATEAGVATYNCNGRWYYVIVYNWTGCNQSGA